MTTLRLTFAKLSRPAGGGLYDGDDPLPDESDPYRRYQESDYPRKDLRPVVDEHLLHPGRPLQDHECEEGVQQYHQEDLEQAVGRVGVDRDRRDRTRPGEQW